MARVSGVPYEVDLPNPLEARELFNRHAERYGMQDSDERWQYFVAGWNAALNNAIDTSEITGITPKDIARVLRDWRVA
jgi:hypothetical protein